MLNNVPASSHLRAYGEESARHPFNLVKEHLMNTGNLARAAIALLSLLMASLSLAGDVGPMPGHCPYAGGCYMISGTIVKDDLKTLGAALANAHVNKKSITVRLNSPGGDFRTAIALGRLMRSAGAHAVGGNTDVCMSSCVMLLAGATFRGHAGRVGIHRPYRMSTAPISVAEMKKEFDSWDSEARSFLNEVNVSSRLWDEMIRIPPENVRILSSDEMSSLGLKGEDLVSEEITDSDNARHYGMSKMEYLQRKLTAARICNPILQRGEFETWRDCDESIKRSGRYSGK